ncbi:PspC domain-containing protein [Sphingomonas sp.]|uniref:PspC domain-containing protein n=1 Tax=Sphingomonas sp. TaxID=28214 RepID=UPI003B001A88
MNAEVRRRLVIDRRQGAWLGVCRGVADYAGVPVGLVRAGAVFLTVAGLGLPGVVAYVATGWMFGRR